MNLLTIGSNLLLMARGLQKGELDSCAQRFQDWFDSDELNLEGFQQHLLVTDRLLRMFHNSTSSFDRKVLRIFVTEYILFVTFEEFENRLNYGTQRSAFAQYLLQAPPEALSLMEEVPVSTTSKKTWKRVRDAFQQIHTEFQSHYRFTNEQHSPPDLGPLRIAIKNGKISGEAMALVHTVLGHRLRWLIDSAAYLRQCFDSDEETHPAWGDVGILPYTVAMSSLTQFLDELTIVVKGYCAWINEWIDPEACNKDLPRPAPSTSADTTMPDVSTAFPAKESDTVLNSISLENWGTGCWMWLTRLTDTALATRWMVSAAAARLFRGLQQCPPTELLQFQPDTNIAFPSLHGGKPRMLWEPALRRAFDRADQDKQVFVDLLRKIGDRNDKFAAALDPEGDVIVSLEALLMMQMVKV